LTTGNLGGNQNSILPKTKLSTLHQNTLGMDYVLPKARFGKNIDLPKVIENTFKSMNMPRPLIAVVDSLAYAFMPNGQLDWDAIGDFDILVSSDSNDRESYNRFMVEFYKAVEKEGIKIDAPGIDADLNNADAVFDRDIEMQQWGIVDVNGRKYHTHFDIVSMDDLPYVLPIRFFGDTSILDKKLSEVAPEALLSKTADFYIERLNAIKRSFTSEKSLDVLKPRLLKRLYSLAVMRGKEPEVVGLLDDFKALDKKFDMKIFEQSYAKAIKILDIDIKDEAQKENLFADLKNSIPSIQKIASLEKIARVSAPADLSTIELKSPSDGGENFKTIPQTVALWPSGAGELYAVQKVAMFKHRAKKSKENFENIMLMDGDSLNQTFEGLMMAKKYWIKNVGYFVTGKYSTDLTKISGRRINKIVGLEKIQTSWTDKFRDNRKLFIIQEVGNQVVAELFDQKESDKVLSKINQDKANILGVWLVNPTKMQNVKMLPVVTEEYARDFAMTLRFNGDVNTELQKGNQFDKLNPILKSIYDSEFKKSRKLADIAKANGKEYKFMKIDLHDMTSAPYDKHLQEGLNFISDIRGDLTKGDKKTLQGDFSKSFLLKTLTENFPYVIMNKANHALIVYAGLSPLEITKETVYSYSEMNDGGMKGIFALDSFKQKINEARINTIEPAKFKVQELTFLSDFKLNIPQIQSMKILPAMNNMPVLGKLGEMKPIVGADGGKIEGILTMNNIEDWYGKLVATRLDLNSSVKAGNLVITPIPARIAAHANTVKELSDLGAIPVILSHQSRPGKEDYTEDLDQHAALMSDIMDKEVTYVPDLFGSKMVSAIESAKPGDILMLKNTRSWEPESVKVKNLNSAQIEARKVASDLYSSHFDIVLLDGFSVFHRDNWSVIGFENMPNVVGRVAELEIAGLRDAINKGFYDKKSLVSLGGMKIDDYTGLMQTYLETNPQGSIAPSGALLNLMLMAKGYNIGTPSTTFLEKEGLLEILPEIQTIYEGYKDQIIMPTSVAALEGNQRIEVSIPEIPTSKPITDLPILDIGIEGAKEFASAAKEVDVVYVKGPLGKYEVPEFMAGSEIFFKAVSESNAFSFGGGGNTADVLARLNVKLNYETLAGGATIKALSGHITRKELSAIKVLKDSYTRFSPELAAKADGGKIEG
ncbi:MAG: phosphoglycerate kinase, partial [Candidatus Omnitrophica bacterium]|nr:phosphoglycerate kinase [Candidatus Omnitrophota bacterium]